MFCNVDQKVRNSHIVRISDVFVRNDLKILVRKLQILMFYENFSYSDNITKRKKEMHLIDHYHKSV